MAFKKPKAFAKMLGIDVYVIMHFKAILAIINVKKVEVDADEFESFCNVFLDWFYQNPEGSCDNFSVPGGRKHKNI